MPHLSTPSIPAHHLRPREGALVARFLDAQNQVYPDALHELRAGQKRGHWMWFIFPQIAGLGHSAMAERFALGDLDEARGYLGHPILCARLHECTEAVLLHAPDAAAPRSLMQLFGTPDDRKFHSSMTLFHRADPDEPLFARALEAFFGGREDEATLIRL
ncbi:DUF1810 domain-containing protein [Devosia lacusdianchii]|uniref:DUF1810 domain-containing protein n=1 Tax=Devosia lacusdianchii TaxID=2917991 RepID=UPI001F050A87|nr:DUF1810 domain-containing protein [Devosia sp. JXJ CY 41]